MNTREGKAWRSLAGAKGVGPKALWQIADYLSNRQKTASWLLQNPDELKTALPGSKINISLPDFIDSEYVEVESFGGREVTVLHPLHPDFPSQIRTLKDKIPLPAILYVAGNRSILNRPSVSIVGGRNAGMPAIAVADSLASELAAKGINITSGYAAGIDTAAHLAALRDGGSTSMVLSEGIDRFCVKPEFQEFVTEENTLVISQFEPDARWAPYFAMTRNKLVCALSKAIVVIVSGPERDASGRMSGTFDAGMAARKLGVPVFVVSPDSFDEKPIGNRQLIARGCREWDPADGSAPILAAMQSSSPSDPDESDVRRKPQPRQLNLFEKGKR